MPITIDGTNGISDVRSTTDGSAATPAIRGTDANTGIFFPAADTIAFSEGGTEAMRINSAGNLGLGVTPSAWGANPKVIEGANGSAFTANTAAPETAIVSNAFFDGTAWKYKTTNPVSRFAVNGFDGTFTWQNAASGTAGNTVTFTERMRINASGYTKISDAGTYESSTSTTHEIRQSANDNGLLISSTNASYTRNVLDIYAARNTSNGTYNLITAGVLGVATRFRVADSGNVTNINNSYGSISDVKLKENIADATPKLEDLCKVKVRQYNLKSDPDHKQIGVVAQELEEVFAGLVETIADKDAEGNDLGTTTKQVKYSVFVPMLIKAMQELKTIVDQQSTELDSVKAELATLKA
jgi:hypothetical protein